MNFYKVDTNTLRIQPVDNADVLQFETNTNLRLKTGRIITLPDNFEVLTIKNGNIAPIKIKDVKIDDLVAVPRRLPNYNHYQKLNNITPLETRLNIIPQLPSTLNEDLAYFLGLISSDGYIRKDDKIVLTNINRKIVSNFKKLVKYLFGLTTGTIQWKEKRKEKIYKWTISLIYSKAVKEFLITNFELREGKKNDYIRVPQIIFNSPKTVVAKYIQGLFDGDGSIVIGQNNIALRFTAKNRDFAYDVQELLLFFDIISYVKETKKNLWDLVVSNKINIERFKNEIGFIHPIRLKKIQKSVIKKECNFVKIGKTIKEERNKSGISIKELSKKIGTGSTTIQHYENNTCLPKVEILKKIAEVLNSKILFKISNSVKYQTSIRERHKLSGFRKVTNDDTLPKELAKKCILEIKEKYSVSQEDIAKVIYTSQGRIGNYERGNVRISHEIIKKLNEKLPTVTTSIIANSDIFWDKIIETNKITSTITWLNIKDFISHKRIIARYN